MKKQKVQPKRVNRVSCKKCGEILAKIYPYAVTRGGAEVGCGKCINKEP